MEIGTLFYALVVSGDIAVELGDCMPKDLGLWDLVTVVEVGNDGQPTGKEQRCYVKEKTQVTEGLDEVVLTKEEPDPLGQPEPQEAEQIGDPSVAEPTFYVVECLTGEAKDWGAMLAQGRTVQARAGLYALRTLPDCRDMLFGVQDQGPADWVVYLVRGDWETDTRPPVTDGVLMAFTGDATRRLHFTTKRLPLVRKVTLDEGLGEGGEG